MITLMQFRNNATGFKCREERMPLKPSIPVVGRGTPREKPPDYRNINVGAARF